ncbi:hypothetical protein MMC07_008812 [Pseudocyphellaria aurata]|nr:hypothetical protein [Pseudocyphellaria aurata]
MPLAMASTRQLEIFQDPTSCVNPDISSESVRSLTVPPLSDQPPLGGRFASSKIVFTPPVTTLTGRSPLKSMRQPTKAPTTGLYDENLLVSFPPPQAPVFLTDSPTKKPTISTLQGTGSQKRLEAFSAPYLNAIATDKENFNASFHSDNFAEFPDPAADFQAPPKRKLLDAAPLQDRQSKKPRLEPKLEPKLNTRPAPKIEVARVPQIPEPCDMPLIEDDGSKPPYSYRSLIGMSILRAPNRRLTLAQIYKWISDTFSYYRASDAGWQNSIRHNLSLNKAFIKQERPKDDPGKGNYWAIEAGMESQFVKDKPTRRPTSSCGPSIRIFTHPSSEGVLSTWPTDSIPAVKPAAQVSDGLEPSSDATISASDAMSHEDEIHESVNMPPPSRLPLSSPLQAIHSSPPVVHRLSNDDDTSPIAPDFPLPSSLSSSRKLKVATLDDSGYFSSLNSSVTRPYRAGTIPFSGTGRDRKRVRRGRAEEEIARIRSSSHEISPSKVRSCLKQPIPQPVSSSPLRHFQTSSMLPPLTPSVTFKMPVKPPASVSPNTNLRNHRNKIRELVGSPVKSISLLHDETPFSPAFNILEHERSAFNDEFSSSFDIFTDNYEDGIVQYSPISIKKRSIRRHRFDRASKTSNTLADVTGKNMIGKTLPSAFTTPFSDSPTRQKPSKSPTTCNDNLFIPEKDDVFDLGFFADEEPDDFGGLDLLQGFQKIGGNRNPSVSPNKTSRPLAGVRGRTSRF